MKHDLELSLQAWLDGELLEKEARQAGEWIARDAEAGALLAELRAIKETLPSNETPRTVPDTREFYWSQIERRLQQPTAAAKPARSSWLARWQALLLPLTGVAAVACALIVTTHYTRTPTFDEICATSDAMEAVTYHDQSGQMTVVWLQNSSPAAPQRAVPNVKSPTQTTDESDGEMD
ncbi:MAG: anti-sigma factor family protein [Limisphaerales bacterium]